MDPISAQTSPVIPNPTSVPSPPPSKPSFFTPRKKLILALGIITFIIIITVIIFITFSRNPNQTNHQATSTPTPQPLTNYPTLSSKNTSLIVGVLSGTSTTIKSYNLQSQEETILATLPTNIKKVSILSGNKFLLISKTDQRDYGSQIDVYDAGSNTTSTLFQAAGGYGIDDYVLSPNQKYLATWEVKYAPKQEVLRGGYSRVYSFSLNNSIAGKQLIYDEEQITNPNKPFHYPRAINDSGEIFCDSFLPNDGAGWAYGMSIASLDGSNISDLPSMKNGTFGTQPYLSPDGNFLAFAGYDGSRGDGTALTNNFRQALITPNTLELLDLKSKERIKLKNLPNNLIYSEVNWDKGGNNLIFTTLGKNTEESGIYLYDLKTNTHKKVLSLGENKVLISSLSDNLILMGTADTSSSTAANLGDSYSPSFTNFSIYNTADQSSQAIKLNDLLLQFIVLKSSQNQPENSVLGTATKVLAQTNTSADESQLKLRLFDPPKPALAPIRTCQQSSCVPQLPALPPPPPILTPPITQPSQPQPIIPPGTPPISGNTPHCVDLYGQQCISAVGGSNEDLAVCARELKSGGNGACQRQLGIDSYTTFNACILQSKSRQNSTCLDSPLYLYGPTGLKVEIKINTPISNSNLLGNGQFLVTLEKNGQIRSNGKLYDNIDYDYQPALSRMKPPEYGMVVSLKELPNILADFAKKLGLKSRETSDLVGSGDKVTSPYVFVSFFDQKTSDLILPISFNPEPNTYQNIVFYFKQLSSPLNYTPIPPTFPEIPTRGKFSAIEISEIVE